MVISHGGMWSISNIGIREAQQRVEQTPLDVIVPPIATGTFQIDPSVIECRLAEGVASPEESEYKLT